MRKTSRQFCLDTANDIPTIDQVLALPWNGHYKVESEDGVTFYVRGWLHKSYPRFYYQCPCCVQSTRKSGLPRANTKYAVHRFQLLNGEHQAIVNGRPMSVTERCYCNSGNCAWYFGVGFANGEDPQEKIPKLTVCACVTCDPNMY